MYCDWFLKCCGNMCQKFGLLHILHKFYLQLPVVFHDVGYQPDTGYTYTVAN